MRHDMCIPIFTMSGIMYILQLVLFLVVPIARSANPGTFFWRPRLGIDLAIPTTEPASYASAKYPSRTNIRDGTVVLVEKYQMGMTVLGIAAGFSSAKPYPSLNPFSAYFYTNVWRWVLRYLSLLPFWAGGSGGHICETHRVWKRRFYYMDEKIPDWMRKMLFYVDKDEWAKEDLDYARFKAHSEAAFGKHYRFPTKRFRNFASYITKETVEVLSSSAVDKNV